MIGAGTPLPDAVADSLVAVLAILDRATPDAIERTGESPDSIAAASHGLGGAARVRQPGGGGGGETASG